MTTLFQTNRLIIRNWIPEKDAESAFEMYSDPDVTRFIGSMIEVSVESQRARLQTIIERYTKLNKGTGFWAVVEKETGQIVGSVMLKQLPDTEGNLTEDYEVGWHLRKSSWGKGYATEAGQAAINYGFNILKLPVIYAVTEPQNHASISVTQRLGMVPIGRTNKYYGGIELELFKLVPS
ncbi:GNAT family N-acetyltransferase [Scytonema hofmannii FACHB-248]|uniref:GNAT family N-acetyltransferase n=1 Tax=Scytonema hofmannii FACHB-248 TaxID=1842502 RepID=A0ABR8GSU0_9CYAN|nr:MULTISPECIES: GNAT family N-acetyltransferase [Nostocales]MBD2606269.1 GNAT family N-acetyltransferase [Scytonema hofmannii FACHB-248]